ncbi:MBL fold metallo-hydrolase [Solibacillus silvestris]|uniref:MBL fold metallo-hydrolase n=1 Tax=Solibacillus silvestris TaxID=76853 RepID=UPI003F7E08C7
MDAILKIGDKAVYPIIFPSDYNGLGSINCYVYQNGNDYTLIDAGIENEEFEQFFYRKLKEYNIEITQITRIILTHFHNDHIGVVNQITRGHPIPVYASEIAIPRLKCEDDYLRQKLAFYYELYEQYGVTEFSHERMAKMENTLRNKEQVMLHPTIIPIEEGQQIEGLRAVTAPGHSPDSICLFDEEVGWLFAGDFLLGTGMTNALIDHDDLGKLTNPVTQYIHSIGKIKAYPVQYVFAGHGAIFRNLDEVMEKSLSKIEYKLQKLVTKIREGHHTAKQLGVALYGARFAKYFVFTVSEIVGLALLAEQRGLIVRQWQDKEWCFKVIRHV